MRALISFLITISLVGCQPAQLTTILPAAVAPISASPNANTDNLLQSQIDKLLKPIYTSELSDPGLGLQAFMATVDLSGAQLELTSVKPGQEIIITGVPTKIGKIRVSLKVANSDVIVWASIRRIDDNRIAVVAPILPSGAESAGDIDLQVVVRGNLSPAFRVHLEALPSVSGVSESLLSKLKDVSNTLQAFSHGLPNPISTDILLDSPDNPNSLKRIIEGTAPILEGDPVDVESLSRVLMSSGALEALDELLIEIRKLRPSGMNTSAVAKSSMSTSSLTKWEVTPEQLSVLVQNQQSLEALTSNKVFSGVQVATQAAYAALTLFLPGGQVATAYILTQWAIIVNSLLVPIIGAAYLPSRLTAVDVEASPSEFYDYHSAFGHWRASIKAENSAVRVDIASVMSEINGEFFSRSNKNLKSILDHVIRDSLIKLGASEATPTLLEFPTAEFITSDASHFCTPYTDKPSVLQISANSQLFKPISPGEANVYVTINPGHFKNMTLRGSRLVVVHDAMVQIHPQPREVFTSSMTTFRLEVIKANGARETANAESWKIKTNQSGATITDSGVYTSGNKVGQDTIEARFQGKSYDISVSVVEDIEHDIDSGFYFYLNTMYIIRTDEGPRRVGSAGFHIAPGDKYSARLTTGKSIWEWDARPWYFLTLKVVRSTGEVLTAVLNNPIEETVYLGAFTVRNMGDEERDPSLVIRQW